MLVEQLVHFAALIGSRQWLCRRVDTALSQLVFCATVRLNHVAEYQLPVPKVERDWNLMTKNVHSRSL